jgi:hypothetical protein
MNPSDSPSQNGMPKKIIAQSPDTNASTTPGIHVSLMVRKLDLCKHFKSISRPDRNNIIESPAEVQTALIFSGMLKLSSETFAMRRPAASIPRRGGKWMSFARYPPMIEKIHNHDRLDNELNSLELHPRASQINRMRISDKETIMI